MPISIAIAIDCFWGSFTARGRAYPTAIETKLNTRQAKPTTAKYLTRMSQLCQTETATNNASKITEKIFIGFSILAAKPGAHLRIDMPITTGNKIIVPTSMIF
jgi:hypothetical protein